MIEDRVLIREIVRGTPSGLATMTMERCDVQVRWIGAEPPPHEGPYVSTGGWKLLDRGARDLPPEKGVESFIIRLRTYDAGAEPEYTDTLPNMVEVRDEGGCNLRVCLGESPDGPNVYIERYRDGWCIVVDDEMDVQILDNGTFIVQDERGRELLRRQR